MVEQIPATGADPTICNMVLPWSSETGPLWLNAKTLYRFDHFIIEV